MQNVEKLCLSICPFVCSSICQSVHLSWPSDPVGQPSDPYSQPLDPSSWLLDPSSGPSDPFCWPLDPSTWLSNPSSWPFTLVGSEGQLKGSEGQAEGSEGQPAGSEGQPGGRVDGQIDKWINGISPNSTGPLLKLLPSYSLRFFKTSLQNFVKAKLLALYTLVCPKRCAYMRTSSTATVMCSLVWEHNYKSFNCFLQRNIFFTIYTKNCEIYFDFFLIIMLLAVNNEMR